MFEALKAFLDIEELNCSVNSLRFSWNNYRSDGSKILARLDRVYYYKQSVTANRSISTCCIQGDAGWSDYHPIEFVMMPSSSRLATEKDCDNR